MLSLSLVGEYQAEGIDPRPSKADATLYLRGRGAAPHGAGCGCGPCALGVSWACGKHGALLFTAWWDAAQEGRLHIMRVPAPRFLPRPEHIAGRHPRCLLARGNAAILQDRPADPAVLEGFSDVFSPREGVEKTPPAPRDRFLSSLCLQR